MMHMRMVIFNPILLQQLDGLFRGRPRRRRPPLGFLARELGQHLDRGL